MNGLSPATAPSPSSGGGISSTLTLAIALVAIGLSLGTLAWSIASFWLSGPRWKVTLQYGWAGPGSVVSRPGFDPSGFEHIVNEGFTVEVFGVEVRNVGRAAGTVTGWMARINGWGLGMQVNPLNKELPKRMESGETESWWAGATEVRALIAASQLSAPVRMHFEVELGTGKKVRTEQVRIA